MESFLLNSHIGPSQGLGIQGTWTKLRVLVLEIDVQTACVRGTQADSGFFRLLQSAELTDSENVWWRCRWMFGWHYILWTNCSSFKAM